jgi:hypothetical protein
MKNHIPVRVTSRLLMPMLQAMFHPAVHPGLTHAGA